MSSKRTLMRITAVAVIVALQGAFIPVSAAPGLASLKGHIVSSESSTPVAGARVHVGDPKSGKIYTSAPTAADGSFSMSGLPASTYELAVESNGGLFTVSTPMTVKAGQDRDVRLAFNAAEPKGSQKITKSKRVKPASKGGFWNNPITASVIVIGSASIIGLVVDNATKEQDEGPSSPFVPVDR